MIEVKDLHKQFKLSKQQKREMGKGFKGSTVEAVAGVSFKCEPGRVFSLLGPNGAGKTTILRIIATMLQPSTGSVEVAGFDSVKDSRKVRQSLGFLTGTTGLYDRLTPLECIKYYADLNEMESSFFKKRRDEIFERLGIHEFAKRRIAKLSSGMKQKVSIARTIIHDPKVVVFDEPTSGLDVITSKEIVSLVRDFRNAGKTVIFSTHIMSEVSLLSDDLAIIHKGELLFNNSYDYFSKNMKSRSLEDEFIRLVEEA